MAWLVGHREPKGAATEMPLLSPPRQSSTLPRLCENSSFVKRDRDVSHAIRFLLRCMTMAVHLILVVWTSNPPPHRSMRSMGVYTASAAGGHSNYPNVVSLCVTPRPTSFLPAAPCGSTLF